MQEGKPMKSLYRVVLTYASVFTMFVAVAGAGMRSTIIVHEPKVPAKLHRD